MMGFKAVVVFGLVNVSSVQRRTVTGRIIREFTPSILTSSREFLQCRSPRPGPRDESAKLQLLPLAAESA